VGHWPLFFERLLEQGRAFCVPLEVGPCWIAAERLAEAQLLWPDVSALADLVLSTGAQRATAEPPGDASRILAGTEERAAQVVSPRDGAATQLTQGWLQVLGPTTSTHLAALTGLHPRDIYQALLAMEMQGMAMRGVFECAVPAGDAPYATEWCERRILQRIHRLTVGTLRKQVEPVTAAVFMRWLPTWQHVAPGTQLAGEEGVLAAIEQLEGFEAPAVEWERTLLPARVEDYNPQWLDNLCLAGVVGWGRISPHPAWIYPARMRSVAVETRSATGMGSRGPHAASSTQRESETPRRVIPTSAAPITFYLRESAEWLHRSLALKSVDEALLSQALSAEALRVRACLRASGAAFTAELERALGMTKLAVTMALWELATAGLACADGFDQMRALMDPRRKTAAIAQTPATSLRKRAAARTTAGRWSLFGDTPGAALPYQASGSGEQTMKARSSTAAIADAKQADAALEAHARVLLGRYGVLFRELLTRESNAPKWRDLLPMLRRLEARGEIRGGRFVSGAFGEQYALPAAVEGLRAARRGDDETVELSVAATDPLNLVGILVPGERVAAVPGRAVRLLNGAAVVEDCAATPVPAKTSRRRSVAEMLRADLVPSSVGRVAPPVSMGLFS
jgi:ATP-dependent Lhr-like helicase